MVVVFTLMAHTTKVSGNTINRMAKEVLSIATKIKLLEASKTTKLKTEQAE